MANGEFVAVDAAGHSQPRPSADEAAYHLVVAERLGNGQRVGVEVEQAPTARDRRGEVAKIVKAKHAADSTPFRGQLDDPDAVGPGRGRATAGGGRPRRMRGAVQEDCHRFERTNELRDAIEAFAPFVAVREGRITAYASSVTFWPLNHGVAESEDDMTALLQGAAAAVEEPIAFLVPLRTGCSGGAWGKAYVW